jgi:peptidoglycan hydrolase-like protein with peptidoglycan-binding domain
LISGCRKNFVLLAALLAGLLLLAVRLLPAQGATKANGKTTAQGKAAPKKPSSVRHSSRRKPTRRTASARSRRSRHISHRQRLARIRMESDRVREIQEALSRAGYYQGEPTGNWDVQTREAMQRFQTEQGFPVTGLPEAKSLMKLGLGPHPLPPDVDPSRARASADNPSANGATGEETPPAESPAPDSPQKR